MRNQRANARPMGALGLVTDAQPEGKCTSIVIHHWELRVFTPERYSRLGVPTNVQTSEVGGLRTTGGDTLGLYQTTHDWWRYLRALLVVIVKFPY